MTTAAVPLVYATILRPPSGHQHSRVALVGCGESEHHRTPTNHGRWVEITTQGPTSSMLLQLVRRLKSDAAGLRGG
jgi:hypothetical protein